MRPRMKKTISFLMYLIPILFFIVCYFVIVTSGEDIWQGAKSTVDIFGDSAAAFNHSVRLADMYAWSIINVFDYVYQFGPDTIFRIIDVLAAGSIIYMATYIALRRRPKLRLKDASVFLIIFLIIFLTSNGLTLYAGFSKIHNYLFITFFSLLFGIMYLRDLWGRKMPKKWWFAIVMLILGFVFGFASNVTAIVFIITVAIYGIIQIISKKIHQKEIKQFFLSWRFAGVVGILASVALMYLVGNGLGDYNTSPIYRTVFDYLPMGEIWNDIPGSIIKIISHNIYNFGRFLIPFAIVSLPLLIYVFIHRKKEKFGKVFKNQSDKNFVLVSVIFIFMHVFAMSQIKYPTRLVLPAYIFAVGIIIWVFLQIFSVKTISPRTVKIGTFTLLILGVATLATRTVFAVNYVSKVSPIFEHIKNSSGDTICIDWEEIRSPSIPYVHMEQEEMLVDWAMPQTIYSKTVSDCGTMPKSSF